MNTNDLPLKILSTIGAALLTAAVLGSVHLSQKVGTLTAVVERIETKMDRQLTDHERRLRVLEGRER